MQAILNVGTGHPLYNKVVDVELTGHCGILGDVEAKTTSKYTMSYNVNIFKDGEFVRSEPTSSYDYVTAWVKKFIK